MPRSYWLPAIALGLIVCIGSGQAQEQTQPTQGQTSSKHSPSQNLDPPLHVEIVDDNAKTDARQRDEDISRDREKADLVAQQGMNSATQRMAIYALWQTVATWVGAFLVFVTLLLMIQANRTAIAAVGAERAWITFDSFEMGPVKFSDGDSFGYIIGWKNSGRSPAINVSLYTDYAIVFPPQEIPLFAPGERGPEDISAHLGPGAPLKSSMRPLKPADAEMKTHLVVYGRAEYSDLFSTKPRISEVCCRVTIHDREQPDGTLYQSFVLSPVGRQNSLS